MKTFIETLPIYDGEITEELIEIALHHFMNGTKMYFAGGYEITTQAGFENAVVQFCNIKRHTIHKIIDNFNKNYVTPDAYRELNYKHKYHLR